MTENNIDIVLFKEYHFNKNIILRQRKIQMATPQLPSEIMPGHEIWGLGVRVDDENEGGSYHVDHER